MGQLCMLRTCNLSFISWEMLHVVWTKCEPPHQILKVWETTIKITHTQFLLPCAVRDPAWIKWKWNRWVLAYTERDYEFCSLGHKIWISRFEVLWHMLSKRPCFRDFWPLLSNYLCLVSVLPLKRILQDSLNASVSCILYLLPKILASNMQI